MKYDCKGKKDILATFFRRCPRITNEEVCRTALDIKGPTFGESQNLVLKSDDIPPYNSAVLYLGSSSIYKDNVGLDKVEGFMGNTNFLIPWSIATVNELKLRQQEAIAAATIAVVSDNNSPKTLHGRSSAKNTFLRASSVSTQG